MSKIVASAIAVSVLFLVASSNAQALPAAPSPGYGAPSVTFISGGCGLGMHRGPWGGCRVDGAPAVVVVPAAPAVIVAPRACPLGFHLGPYGQRCWRN
jgi:hypothetical protein